MQPNGVRCALFKRFLIVEHSQRNYKSRCIIHVGMHKTGTTSIQHSLEGFDNERFIYADLDSVCNHSLAVFSVFARHPERHHLHKAAGRKGAEIREYNNAIRQDLKQCIAQTEGRTLVISGEDISVLSRSELVEMYDYFHEHFETITIVAYIRPPAAFMTSAFQQRIKGGNIGFNLERTYRNYRQNFEKFDDVFGRNNVQLWKFDPGTFPGNCVVRDFCARLGISIPLERIVRFNESFSRQVVGLLYTYKKFGKEFRADLMRGPESQHLAQRLSGVGTTKFRFSPSTVRPILNANRADIEWMESRLGKTLTEDLGSSQPGDVTDERDLIHTSKETAHQLRMLVGDRGAIGISGRGPREISVLVHAIRTGENLKRVRRKKKKRSDLSNRKSQTKDKLFAFDVCRLVQEMKLADSKVTDGIPEEKVAAILENAFNMINVALEQTKRGVVRCEELGRFRIKQVGKGSAGTRRTIIFQRAVSDGKYE